MPSEYVEQREGGLYVAGSRVSLASIIYSFRGGDSPETIRQNFPSLSLAQVYGAIAFYLSNGVECEEYLRMLKERWAELEAKGRDKPSGRRRTEWAEELSSRLEAASQELANVSEEKIVEAVHAERGKKPAYREVSVRDEGQKKAPARRR